MLVIPDVHGLSFWKEPVNRYINEVDRVVFLGDYLDPYSDNGESVDTDDIFGNLVEIVNVKLKHKEKVVLLIGNHDYHYFSKRALQVVRASRCDLQNWRRNNEFFIEHENEFCVAHLERVKNVTYLLKECRTLGGCETGKSKMTDAYNLPCMKVIHTVGPIWYGGNNHERELLASCYDTAMKLAEENDLKSIAFSCISTGVYGFPKAEAAEIARQVLTKHIENGYQGEVIVCCFTEADVKYYQL